MPKRRFSLQCRVAEAGEGRAELMIYSAIEPYSWDGEVTSRNFDKELRALGDVEEITVRINSPGGAVNEAIAIRTALMKHGAKKIIDIEGTCASAATLIACLPGAHVRMAKGGDYMIHRCSWVAIGTVDDMLSAYNSMMNTDRDMADIYAERTGMTQEECLEKMRATTWYTAEQAVEAGFVDEIIQPAAEADVPIAASLDPDACDLMRECYGPIPEGLIRRAQPGEESVRREKTAVAAGVSSEIQGETPETPIPEQKEENHMELRDATAEAIQTENPAAAAEIARQAVEAERARRNAILSLTPIGAKWQQMAEAAIDNGDSEADFLRAVIAEQRKTGEEYLQARREETRQADNIGAGDAGDHDTDRKKAEDDAAREIADIARGMTISAVNEMA